MKKSSKYILIACIGLFSLSAFKLYENDRLFEISKNIDLFVSVFRELNKNYVDDVDPSTLMKTGIDAMVGSLDPYTNYITESQVERYRISDDERFQGIGASVAIIDEKIYLSDLLEGGAAEKGGLKAGDEIKSINGELIKGKSKEDVLLMLRGTAGSPVKLVISRHSNGKEEILTIERDEVNIPNVPYAGVVDKGIAYINLTTFTDNAAANINKELKRMKREAKEGEEIKGLIIDLRHNGGGLLREAVSICNLFMPKGEEVVFTRGKLKEKDQSFKTMSVPEDLDIPITVLVDKKSASASEIVSGVLQDKDRAVIIGQRSYGKGLVQNIFELGYNNRVKITTSKYYIPSGRCIQGVEYADGEPVDIPDNKRTKFKTKNGRNVLDGGGITPDVKTPSTEVNDITKALLDQNIIFSYVNDYVLKNDSIRDIDQFSFLKYDEFVAFTKKKNFTYLTSGELEVKALEDALKDKGELKSQLNSDISSMKNKFNSAKANDFIKYKDEIVKHIEKEIISRYFYQKGATKLALRRDKEVEEAIAILKDKARYNSILGIK